jgi:hypothetical protein
LIRLELSAESYHEWRSNQRPYQIGASHWFRDGMLSAQGKELARIPTDTWVKIAISYPLGRDANGTYQLTLKIANQASLQFDHLSCGTPTLRRLEWFGFVSNANEKVAVCLDDVKVEYK